MHQTTVFIIVIGLIIGSVSFAGSMIAWGKLNGKIKDFSFKGQNVLNLLVLALAVVCASSLVVNPNQGMMLYVILILYVHLYFFHP